MPRAGDRGGSGAPGGACGVEDGGGAGAKIAHKIAIDIAISCAIIAMSIAIQRIGDTGMSINQALENFISDARGATFEKAVKDSTQAGFGGSGYSVELFEDGTFRVLWNGQIGNMYRSSGVILGVPQLDQETINDMQEYGDDADLSFAMKEAEASVREALAMKAEVRSRS